MFDTILEAYDEGRRDGMMFAELSVQQLSILEEENKQLRKLLADRADGTQTPQVIVMKNVELIDNKK